MNNLKLTILGLTVALPSWFIIFYLVEEMEKTTNWVGASTYGLVVLISMLVFAFSLLVALEGFTSGLNNTFTNHYRDKVIDVNWHYRN